MPSTAKKRAAQEIANRAPCADFEKFQPLFEQTKRELKAGVHQSRPFNHDASFQCWQFFCAQRLVDLHR